MLSNVSWGQFLTVAGVLLAIYYLAIAGYLRKDVAAYLSKLQKRRFTANGGAKSPAKHSIEQLESIVGDLRTNVFGHLGRATSKEELLSLLQAELADYQGIQNKAYRYALGNAIVQMAAEVCGVQIEEEDLNALWNKI